MKRNLIFIFSLYFFLTSVGVAYGTHQCGKRSSNSIWGLSISKEEACKCKNKTPKHHNSCCKNTTKWIKAQTDDSKTHAKLNLRDLQITAVVYLFVTFFITNVATDINLHEVSHSPPLLKAPTFITFRSILI